MDNFCPWLVKSKGSKGRRYKFGSLPWETFAFCPQPKGQGQGGSGLTARVGNDR